MDHPPCPQPQSMPTRLRPCSPSLPTPCRRSLIEEATSYMAKVSARQPWFESTKPADQYPEVSFQRCPKSGTTWQVASSSELV